MKTQEQTKVLRNSDRVLNLAMRDLDNRIKMEGDTLVFSYAKNFSIAI